MCVLYIVIRKWECEDSDTIRMQLLYNPFAVVVAATDDKKGVFHVAQDIDSLYFVILFICLSR